MQSLSYCAFVSFLSVRELCKNREIQISLSQVPTLCDTVCLISRGGCHLLPFSALHYKMEDSKCQVSILNFILTVIKVISALALE